MPPKKTNQKEHTKMDMEFQLYTPPPTLLPKISRYEFEPYSVQLQVLGHRSRSMWRHEIWAVQCWHIYRSRSRIWAIQCTAASVWYFQNLVLPPHTKGSHLYHWIQAVLHRSVGRASDQPVQDMLFVMGSNLTRVIFFFIFIFCQTVSAVQIDPAPPNTHVLI